VHGFEPFHKPFARALENFSLNPELAKKIIPSNTGLSSTDQELSVLSSAHRHELSTSIRGQQTGNPETITIQNATEIFAGLISRAKSNGWEVITKLDCEGSEFAIIESLAAAGLLKDIRVLMVEWHKWWSSDKSQRDIVAPLIEDNFVIFDHTVPADPYAGMLYAVRTSEAGRNGNRAGLTRRFFRGKFGY
jgi:FkbM family methyltransferase